MRVKVIFMAIMVMVSSWCMVPENVSAESIQVCVDHGMRYYIDTSSLVCNRNDSDIKEISVGVSGDGDGTMDYTVWQWKYKVKENKMYFSTPGDSYWHYVKDFYYKPY